MSLPKMSFNICRRNDVIVQSSLKRI